MNLKFSDIEWGSDEAREDDGLKECFVKIPGFDKILQGDKRYIIGRKGTGKTAVLQRIRIQADEDYSKFYADISLRDFPLTDFKQMQDKGYQNKSKYVSAWKFLLYTEICKLLLEDNSIEDTQSLKKIKDFMSENYFGGISIIETIKQLTKTANKVKLGTMILSGEHDCGENKEITSTVHYQKVVKLLNETIKEIRTESTFYLLIDELDEGYKAADSNINLVILALLRASQEIYNEFNNSSIKCIPVLALRADIFDNLSDNDLNKLDDYVLRLNWNTDESSKWSLKQIVEERVSATIRRKYPGFESEDYWGLVVSTDKDLWKNICILTFSRPRDIIKLLKCCSNVDDGDLDKLSLSAIEAAEASYSDWFYREFRDEVQSFISCWREILNCISELGRGKGDIKSLVKKLDDNQVVSVWCKENKKSSTDIVKLLFDYSVIGCVNADGRWLFKYKDSQLEYAESYPYYCVHYGLCKKLRISKNDSYRILASVN